MIKKATDTSLNDYVVTTFMGISGVTLIGLLAWIANTVSTIPVINERVATLIPLVQDHETRIRILEAPKSNSRSLTQHFESSEFAPTSVSR